MKSTVIMLAVVFVSLAYGRTGEYIISTNNRESNFSISQVDSFAFYYKKLKHILKKNPYDTSSLCIIAVRYMESYTKIKAHPDGNYFGWFLFTRNDLVAWKEWRKNNRTRSGLGML
ncbi:MAG: hypothetical protein J0I84_20655 [Terrimonas sp.]|nr:hypothetical protein [Terrimonas sp.]